MKKVFNILFLAAFLMGIDLVSNAQAATIDLTTCAQVTNLIGTAGNTYVVTVPLNCSTPININVPAGSLTIASGASLDSSVSVTINEGAVSGSTGTGGTIGISSGGGTISTGTGSINGTGTISIGTTTSTGGIISSTSPVNATAYLYDYDTGGSLRPNTRNIAMVLSLENTTVGVNNNLNALSISSYSAVDLEGKEVNLSLPATIVLNKPFNGSVYGVQKYVLGPYLVRPLSEAQISGGLVVNMVIPWGGTSLNVSTTASFNQANN